MLGLTTALTISANWNIAAWFLERIRSFHLACMTLHARVMALLPLFLNYKNNPPPRFSSGLKYFHSRSLCCSHFQEILTIVSLETWGFFFPLLLAPLLFPSSSFSTTIFNRLWAQQLPLKCAPVFSKTMHCAYVGVAWWRWVGDSPFDAENVFYQQLEKIFLKKLHLKGLFIFSKGCRRLLCRNCIAFQTVALKGFLFSVLGLCPTGSFM